MMLIIEFICGYCFICYFIDEFIFEVQCEVIINSVCVMFSFSFL